MRDVWLKAAVVAAWVWWAWAGVPSASAIVTGVVTRPITAGAITDDPQLANRITNDVQVTVLSAADWTNSEIKIQLTQGSIYNAANAVATESSPNPAFWTTAGFRNGEFDTFVNSKDFAPASLAGKFPDDGPGPAVGLSGNNATTVSAAWFDTIPNENGTFTVGRFTLSNDAVGTFVGRSFDSTAPGVPTPFSGTIANGVMTIPEPASAGLLAAAAAGLGVRRRRRV